MFMKRLVTLRFTVSTAQSPVLDPLQQAYTGMQHYTGELVFDASNTAAINSGVDTTNNLRKRPLFRLLHITSQSARAV